MTTQVVTPEVSITTQELARTIALAQGIKFQTQLPAGFLLSVAEIAAPATDGVRLSLALEGPSETIAVCDIELEVSEQGTVTRAVIEEEVRDSYEVLVEEAKASVTEGEPVAVVDIAAEATAPATIPAFK